jgi:NAD(P)H-hydrate epimerase
VDAAQSFAMRSRSVLLLKGTPTIVASPDGSPPFIVARGTPALATGGSGDMLTGIIATIAAQKTNPFDAAVIGSWIHGRASELAVENAGSVRGTDLDVTITHLAAAWRDFCAPRKRDPGVLAVLPRVLVDA